MASKYPATSWGSSGIRPTNRGVDVASVSPRICQREGCGVDISNRHPTAKSCSTRCKDKVRNKKPSRKEYLKNRNRIKREENPEYFILYRQNNKQAISELYKAWRLLNLDYKSEYNKSWYLSNTQHVSEYNKQWRGKNPEKVKIHKSVGNTKRRAVKLQCLDNKDYPYWLWVKTLNRQRHLCYYCGSRFTEKDPSTKDHVQPLKPKPVKEGFTLPQGSHREGNIVAAHRSCNASKGNKILMKWRRRPKMDWSTYTIGRLP